MIQTSLSSPLRDPTINSRPHNGLHPHASNESTELANSQIPRRAHPSSSPPFRPIDVSMLAKPPHPRITVALAVEALTLDPTSGSSATLIVLIRVEEVVGYGAWQ